MKVRDMKIVISGTYSTGKTLTSIALSLLTGVPVTHARTMRELLTDYLPGKRLENCNFHELIELGVRRFTERIIAEKNMSESFITDGCPLQEWLYGSTRILTGLNPAEAPEIIEAHKLAFADEWHVFNNMIQGLGRVAKEYTKNNYNKFIHLPIEFPLDPDGHRPVSEKFRSKSEQILLDTYKELGIEALTVTGSIEDRLQQIIKYFNIPPKMNISEAVCLAVGEKKKSFDSIKLEMI